MDSVPENEDPGTRCRDRYPSREAMAAFAARARPGLFSKTPEQNLESPHATSEIGDVF